MKILRDILCTLGLHRYRGWTDEGLFYLRPGDKMPVGRMFFARCTHCGAPRAKVVKP